MTKRRERLTEAPLFAWGDALRARRSRMRTVRRRAALVACGIAALGATLVSPPQPRLVWNVSASAPIGPYLVTPGTAIVRGERVIAWPPARHRAFAAVRGYLPVNVPLVKRVAAVAGDEVCAHGPAIMVNRRVIALRRAADPRARPLPWWRGCIRLAGGQALLLGEHPDSYDGRYFGVSADGDIVGKARLLWAR